MSERAVAHINLTALKHNLQIVKSFAPQQSILAMIKANAYGHGLIRVAQALQDADAFGVACIDEALSLHEAKITQPIVLMAGVTSAEELRVAAAHKFEIIIHHITQLEILRKTELKNPIKIWLKIDTGMHRLGFAPEAVPAIYQQLISLRNVKQPLCFLSHFAESDNLLKPTTAKQLECFQQVTENLPGPKSMANSAGIIAWPQSHFDWVRPGIMLYGVSPINGNKNDPISLQPVMTLKSKLIAINHLQQGDAVGYGGTWVCPEDMPVGVVSIGYGDGYSRHAKNGTPVLINGSKCPLIGRVSMDLITIDLRSCPEAKVGDVVTLWGEGLPVEEVSPWVDTIPYTLLCGVTQRVKFEERGRVD